ncbi:MAG: Trx7/PDZ domain-containing (seleno)protein, partial [Planctomycetota bacterium]|nr:Trx7/PDZ domain-containing (seleno)protein [Planctomycetota bacterium]
MCFQIFVRNCFCFFATFLLASPVVFSQDDLRQRIDDKNGSTQDFWIYNDISKARKIALQENKPLFVTFRCVPCKACQSFDAEVAQGNEKIKALAKREFISVRQIEMKNVDLSLFEFDHDLNWAAMFINPDGTVYGRYGTQSAEGPDAYNSIQGLLQTMNRVLEIHKSYPQIKHLLKDKRRTGKPTYALDLPGLKNAEKLAQITTRSNCVHCHTIHDATHFAAQEKGVFTRDMLWKFPLPDTVGLVMDRVSGIGIKQISENSPASKAGLKVGDRIKTMNGQLITSVADLQWVLHHLPNSDTQIEVTTAAGKDHQIKVKKGWKQYDISWRGSIWSVSPILRIWAPALEPKKIKELNLQENQTAFLVRW